MSVYSLGQENCCWCPDSASAVTQHLDSHYCIVTLCATGDSAGQIKHCPDIVQCSVKMQFNMQKMIQDPLKGHYHGEPLADSTNSVVVYNVLHVPMAQSTVPARPSRLARRGLAAHIRPGLCVTAGLITLQ